MRAPLTEIIVGGMGGALETDGECGIGVNVIGHRRATKTSVAGKEKNFKNTTNYLGRTVRSISVVDEILLLCVVQPVCSGSGFRGFLSASRRCVV